MLGVGPSKSSFREARKYLFLSLGGGGGMVSYDKVFQMAEELEIFG